MDQADNLKHNTSDDLSVTDNLRIARIQDVANPKTIIDELPASDDIAALVTHTRAAAHRVLDGTDDRIIAIIGPGSIPDPEAALDYAARLKTLRDTFADDLLIIMRVYFEKPSVQYSYFEMMSTVIAKVAVEI